MEFIIEIAKVYDYIKKLEQKNKDLEMKLENVRKSYSKLNKEIIKLELNNQEVKKWLKEEIDTTEGYFRCVLDKINELEGVDK